MFRNDNEDRNKGKIFLVTNKHVLNKESAKRQNATKINLHLNIIDRTPGHVTAQEAEIPLSIGNSKRWREHPDRDIDVLAIDITQLLVENTHIKAELVDYNILADSNKIKELDIAIGDEIMVVGYPMGLRHRRNNLPLVRGGILATQIGESLEDEQRELDGSYRKRILRGFLIDGAVIPGSSGSRVVLKPDATENVSKFINEFFPANGKKIPRIIWDGIRNGTNHNFSPNSINVSKNHIRFSFFVEADLNKKSYIDIQGHKIHININSIEFYNILKEAINKYKGRLEID